MKSKNLSGHDPAADTERPVKPPSRVERAPARGKRRKRLDLRRRVRRSEDQQLLQELETSKTHLRYLEQRLEVIESVIRTDMAAKLHDSLGQILAGSLMQLQAAEELATAGKDVLKGHLVRAQELNRRAISITRTGVWTWSGVDGFKLGELPERLQQLCRRLFDHGGIHYHFSAPLARQPLRVSKAKGLFLAGRQALANVALHSGATELWVDLYEENNPATLSIRDNGKGFDLHGPRKHYSFGLVEMRRRIEAIGGKVKIRTAPGEGTLVEIQVPNRGVDPESISPAVTSPFHINRA